MAGQEGDAAASLRYDRSPQAPDADHRTLAETERAVAERLDGLVLDMTAMAAVQNLYRAAGAIRNHLERSVLAPHGLTWTGWVVLWVVWIWTDIEARHVAAEAGISKGTLTGVLSTLESRGLLARRTHPDDARRVLITLTARGEELMRELFPVFNAQEAVVTASLAPADRQQLADLLRAVVRGLDRPGPLTESSVDAAAASCSTVASGTACEVLVLCSQARTDEGRARRANAVPTPTTASSSAGITAWTPTRPAATPANRTTSTTSRAGSGSRRLEAGATQRPQTAATTSAVAAPARAAGAGL